MPELRTQNDFAPRRTLDERALGYEAPQLETLPERTTGEGAGATPTASAGYGGGMGVADPRLVAELDRRMAASLKKLARSMHARINRIGQGLDGQREAAFEEWGGFLAVCDRAERAIKGVIETGDKDRFLKLRSGLSKRAVETACAATKEYLFDMAAAPCEYNALGDDDEGPWLELVMQMLWTDWRRHINYKALMSTALRRWATYPLGVLRQTWVEETGLEENEAGELEERTLYRGPRLRVWNPRHVWFSDIERETEDAARLVIWYEEVSLAEIALEEEVREVRAAAPAGLAGPIELEGVERIRGRFMNLEDVRRRLKREGSTPRLEQMSWVPQSKMLWARGDSREASPTVGKLEVEGYYPLGDDLLEGKLDPALLDYLRLGIGPTDAKSMEPHALARRLNSIHWTITMTPAGELLELHPTDYKPWRNTAVACPYSLMDGLLGQGVHQRGGHLEDAADKKLNAHVWAALRKERPTRVVSEDATIRDEGGEALSHEDVELLDGIGETIWCSGDPKQAIYNIPVELDERFGEEFERLVTLHEELTRITTNVRGVASDKTATQANQNFQKSTLVVNKGAEIFGERVIEKIERNLWADVERFMPVEELQREILRISGKRGLKAVYMIPTTRGLGERVDIRHSGSPTANRIVRTQQLMDMTPMFVKDLGTMDAEVAQEELLKLQGENNPARFAAKGARPTAPREEIRLMAMDRYVSPSRRENASAHLLEHRFQWLCLKLKGGQAEAMGLVGQGWPPEWVQAAIQAQGTPPGLENWHYEDEIVLVQLEQHIAETEELEGEQMQAAMAGAAIDVEAEEVGAERPGLPAATTDATVAQGAEQGATAGLPSEEAEIA